MNNLLLHLKILFSHISTQHKKLIFLNFILLVIASIAEVISISAIIPFLSIISKGEYSVSSLALSKALKFIFQFDKFLILFFFIASVLSAAILKAILLYTSTRIAFIIGNDLSTNVYKKIIYQNYLFFTQHKSSDIINAVTFKTTNIIYQVITPLISIVSSIVLIFFIIVLLFLVDPFISLFSFLIFAIIYSFIVLLVKKRLGRYSKLISNYSSLIVKFIQESFANIREIIIASQQEKEIKIFSEANLELRKAQAFSGFVGNVPKIFVESFTLIAFASIAYIYLELNKSNINLIPIFGALALGAQKILPLIQNIFLSYTYIQTTKDSLKDINYYLNLKIPLSNNAKKIKFLKFIRFESLSFAYEGKKNILDDIDFQINAGDKIGLIGDSGSGKSTLIDIISGLLMPSSGRIIVDNKKLNFRDINLFKKNVSLISQGFYINNLSILENLCFGSESLGSKSRETLNKKAEKILRICNCDFINCIYENFGENAIKLSGGQRQRLAIARGLMRDADIYIFDEATSAIDNKNEEIILKNIFNYLNKKTCIFISHNKSSLKHCNKIFSIKSNKIIQIK